MANYKAVEIDALESKLTAIGDAIRSKTGGTELLTLEDMATSIGGIKSNDDYFAEVMNKQIDKLVNDKVTGELPTNFQRGNKNLTIVDLPLITKMNSSIFYDCSNLKSVNLPSLKEMGAEVFGCCSQVTEIYLPELTTISGWGYVFNVCFQLQKIILPKLTSQFGSGDFNACGKLTTLVLGANTVVPLTNANAFANTAIKNGTGYIYVPRAQLEAYKAATNWSTLASQFRAIEDYPGIMEV